MDKIRNVTALRFTLYCLVILDQCNSAPLSNGYVCIWCTKSSPYLIISNECVFHCNRVMVSPRDVSVFVIGINEFGVLEVLVFVTLADGTIAPATVLLNVAMVSLQISFAKPHPSTEREGCGFMRQ